MDDAEIIKILLKFQEYLSLTSIWTAPLRVIGWLFLMGLSKCVDGLSGGVSEVYDLINFFDSDQVNDFITRFMPVIFALSSAAIAFLGWKIIVQKKTDYSKIVSSSLFAVTLFLVLPWGMHQASNLVSTGKDVLDDDGKLSVSTKIYQNNIIDVYKIDQADWNKKKLNKIKRPNNIESDTDVALLDITESVDTGGLWHSSPLSDDGQKILKKKVSDASGKKTLEDLQTRWIQEDEAYYRYAWHPWYMFFELATIGFVLFMTLFRTVQMIMELGILKIFSAGTVLTDLESGQRNKRFLEKIRNTFIVMFAIVLLLQCYIIFTDFVGKSDLSGPVKIVALIAAGILTIDGPAFIDEMFGIDAGMKSIGRSLVGLFAGARTAQMGADLAKNAVGKTARGLGKLGKKVGGGTLVAAGTGKGVLDGFKERAKSAKSDGAGGQKSLGKNSSPLSKALKGQPTNVLSDEALKESMIPADDQKGKNEGPETKGTSGESPLRAMSSQSNGEPEQAAGGTGQSENGNTPLGAMPSQSNGEPGQAAGGTGQSENGNTPLGAMPSQSNGEPGQAAGGIGQSENGNTPLGAMPSQSNGEPGQAAGGTGQSENGNTPLGAMPSQSNGESGQAAGGTGQSENGNTPLGAMPSQSNGEPGQAAGGTGRSENGNTPLGAIPVPSNGESGQAVGGNARPRNGSSSVGIMPAGPLSGESGQAAGGNARPRNGNSPVGIMSAGPLSGESGQTAGGNARPRNGNSPVGIMSAGPLSGESGQTAGGNRGTTPSVTPTYSGASGNRFSANSGQNKGVLPSHGTSIINPTSVNNSSAPNRNTGRFDYTPKMSGSVSSKPIILPKHVQSATGKLKDHMVRRPTTQHTAKDMIVSKYADLAQKVYDSQTVTNARKAYDVAKNTVTEGYKGEDK
ncbi:hypothetical protein EQZ20_24585 (plasmid) [Bacillus glycinifermentans]|uniref:DUF8208 domain-containing protein n=1 Tax=Bacillus glycinifermentans TaxID=1664069 RepID=A0AAJ4D544_9BACI|nr:hypothetical protein [Bacillus glycinifermentans]QAT68053.1 hypothetical protein EQZ20_24585 [Bacillus glycinifermentans]